MTATAIVRQLRLVSGLVLLAYLTTHFANHALGLISLDRMEDGREWFLWLWRNRVGTAALYGALVIHALLAFWALYRRRHLRMPPWEAAQLVLGLAIPPLLVSHIVGTRLAHTMFDVTDSYTRTVLSLWVLDPWGGARQALVLLIAWTHGCIGIHFWLRLRPWYRPAALTLYSVALLLPALALLGFANAGREAAVLAQTAGFTDSVIATSAEQRAILGRLATRLRWGYLIALAAVLVARQARLRLLRGAQVRISYPSGRTVSAPAGLTVLEASRLGGIPHASVCGGRGRCSTCRVRVEGGIEALPAARPEEQRVLERVGAPPGVRLACQVRPVRDVAVAPLLPATAGPAQAAPRGDGRGGREQEIAVLFADLRGFTGMAERKLPYDVVFVLNRYCDVIGAAISGAGGVPNQFSGDGVMALFGVDHGPEDGCRRALAAARAMVAGIATLNAELAVELPTPLKIGIGIHTGPAIVGRMGYGESAQLTAIGDTVNVAARLEQLTKDYQCALVMSEDVGTRAGIDVSALPRHELTVRNRAAVLAVRTVDDVTTLAPAARA
ncbi:MAG TPA: adenylate/guanylate cyclase domain-containing protein [Candidatus Acidoferrum sp.]|nr:adenylate/guanylate cyclase domain-containing protein [Candidatus Acidoferrum sp.]